MTRPVLHRIARLARVVALVGLTGTAAAAQPRSAADGAYGRFDGDLDIGLSLGAELAPETRRASARLSMHYFWMAGLAVGYADALGSDQRPERDLSVGVDLRPLFIPRWSNDLTRGPALLDLTLDSLSLGAGGFWAQPQDGDFGSERGFVASAGIGIPLLARARGPWFEARAVARWPSRSGDPSPRAEGSALILIGWHELVQTGIARRAEWRPTRRHGHAERRAAW